MQTYSFQSKPTPNVSITIYANSFDEAYRELEIKLNQLVDMGVNINVNSYASRFDIHQFELTTADY